MPAVFASTARVLLDVMFPTFPTLVCHKCPTTRAMESQIGKKTGRSNHNLF